MTCLAAVPTLAADAASGQDSATSPVATPDPAPSE
jgi:hypothetical protein